MPRPPDLSIVVPVTNAHADLSKIHRQYSEPLRKLGRSFEFVYVVSAEFASAFEQLRSLGEGFPEVRVIRIAPRFSESIALMTGFRHAQGATICTLPPYFQSEPPGIVRLIREIDEGADMVVARRFPRRNNVIHRLQSYAFHALVRWTTGFSYGDLILGLRAMKREVALALDLTGDFHRFLPILAAQQGYVVKEVDVAQRREDTKASSYRLSTSLRRLFDVFALYFVVKFTRKPLRFFGFVGALMSCSGFAVCLYLSAVRLLGNQAIAGRPLLLLGLILTVVGMQVASLGLLGELISFSNGSRMKEFHVQEVVANEKAQSPQAHAGDRDSGPLSRPNASSA